MGNFWGLLKIQFFSNFKINKILQRKKGGKVGGFVLLILFALFLLALFGVAGYIYSESSYLSLLVYGREKEIISVMIAYTIIISFFFSFYAISFLLYNSKDYDMLIAMPIKKSEIVLSKLAYNYITEFVLSLVVMIGCLIFYNSVLPLDTLTIISVIVVTLVSPLFAIIFSIIIGTLFAIIASKFKRKNVIQIILYSLFCIAYFLAGFISGIDFDVTKIISKIFFAYNIVNNAIGGERYYLLLYCAICVVGFSLIAYIVCLFYEKLNSIMSTKKTTKKYVEKEYRIKSAFHSVIFKEFRRFFSSPIYVMNTLVCSIFSLIIFVTLMIVSFNVEGFNEMGSIVLPYMPIVFIFMFGMAPTTVCSISIEGKNYWIYKTMPIGEKIFFSSKLLVNYILNIPVVIACSICVIITFKIEVVTAILFILLALVIVVFSGVFGLYINILFPNLKWENEHQAIKQSFAMFITVMIAMILSAIYFVIEYYVASKINIMLLVSALLFIIASVVLFLLVFKNGQKLLDKKLS